MATYEELVNQLPTKQLDFVDLRKQGLVYVDKTRYLDWLIDSSQPRILFRPDGFGKRLLVSTLEELFLHGVEPYDGHDSYFKGLEMETLWPKQRQHEGPFYVLRLNFKELLQDCKSMKEFKERLNDKVLRFASDAHLEIKNKYLDLGVISAFESLLDVVPDHSVVLLVENFEAPLFQFCEPNDNDELQKIVRSLTSFVSNLKTSESKFRFSLITGSTSLWDWVDLFYGNVLEDISQHPTVALLCGFTREELQRYFPEHLRYAAAQLAKVPLAEVTEPQVEHLLDELCAWYGGYNFNGSERCKVLSPTSILSFFRERQPSFQTYWFDRYGVPELLRKLDPQYEWVKRLRSEAGKRISRQYFEFSYHCLFVDMPESIMLFRAGFLTVAEVSFNDLHLVSGAKLGIPNKEIETALARLASAEGKARPQG